MAMFRIPILGVAALLALSVVATADARPGARDARNDPAARPTFHGKRTPAKTRLIKREPKRVRRPVPTRRSRRGRSGKSAPAPNPRPNLVYTAKTVADTGKLKITYAKSNLWKVSGFYMSKAPVGRMDFAVQANEDEHVMLKCEVNPAKTGMVLKLTRDGGPTLAKTLSKKGHQFVTFAIPNAPESFEFSLAMEGLPGMISSAPDWVFYSCEIPI